MFALRGGLAILFGVAALMWPQPALSSLALFFGTYAVVDGGFDLFGAFSKDNTRRWILGWLGLITLSLGITALLWRGITVPMLLYFIALRFVAMGVFEANTAIQSRDQIDNEWLLAGMGLLSAIAGVALIVTPEPLELTVVAYIAAYIVVVGVFLIAMAWRLRRHQLRAAPQRALRR